MNPLKSARPAPVEIVGEHVEIANVSPKPTSKPIQVKQAFQPSVGIRLAKPFTLAGKPSR